MKNSRKSGKKISTGSEKTWPENCPPGKLPPNKFPPDSGLGLGLR